ncbi:MAG: Smr/MutS family protein [Urechidicola sp.]|nr:Smr/MutS family protein [Urechidicola sp.]
MKLNIGDVVVVTDDVLKGVITNIIGETIVVKTEDGFTLNFHSNELVKIPEEQSEIAKKVVVSHHLSQKTDYKKGGKAVKQKRTKELTPAMEVDLHIQKLTKSTKGMDNYDILSLQMDTAKHKIEFAIRNRIPRVVFIHGVGEGVLKEELHFLLNRYPVKLSEASYQKYGMGATEVYLIQNTKDT